MEKKDFMYLAQNNLGHFKCKTCEEYFTNLESARNHLWTEHHLEWFMPQETKSGGYDWMTEYWDNHPKEHYKTYAMGQWGMSEQPTNKYDTGKLRIDLVPPAVIEAVAEIREYGNNKYKDPDSWKTVEPYRYIAALGRHFCEYLRDPQSVDAESGISHLKHMACNVAFLLELEHMKGEGE